MTTTDSRWTTADDHEAAKELRGYHLNRVIGSNSIANTGVGIRPRRSSGTRRNADSTTDVRELRIQPRCADDMT